MADYLKTFEEGEDILASDTNANNQYLLSKLSDNAEALQTYLKTQIASIQSNISSIQENLRSNIQSLSDDINAELAGRKFTQRSATIGIGTTSLKTYLPDDDYSYIVWVSAYVFGKTSTQTNLQVSTDVLTEKTSIATSDADANRWSNARATTVVPVGSGRSITMSLASGSLADVKDIKILGYARL